MSPTKIHCFIIFFLAILLQGCGDANDCDSVYSKIKKVEKNSWKAAESVQRDANKSCNLWRENIEILDSINVGRAYKLCPIFEQQSGALLIARQKNYMVDYMQSKRCRFD